MIIETHLIIFPYDHYVARKFILAHARRQYAEGGLRQLENVLGGVATQTNMSQKEKFERTFLRDLFEKLRPDFCRFLVQVFNCRKNTFLVTLQVSICRQPLKPKIIDVRWPRPSESMYH